MTRRQATLVLATLSAGFAGQYVTAQDSLLIKDVGFKAPAIEGILFDLGTLKHITIRFKGKELKWTPEELFEALGGEK